MVNVIDTALKIGELKGDKENFIDFEGYGKYMGDCYAQECENGIIEICA